MTYTNEEIYTHLRICGDGVREFQRSGHREGVRHMLRLAAWYLNEAPRS